MANNGTVELTAAGLGATVVMTDATGDADTLNVVTKDLATVNVGSISVNGVETIAVTTTDTFTDTAAFGTAQDIFGNAIADGEDDANSAGTLYVTGDDITTVTVAGAGDLTLITGASTLTTVDATNLTGKLTYTAAVAEVTVKGGSSVDTITVTADDVIVMGNGGNDVITVNAGADRAQLTGGAGADKFVIAGASSTQNSYAVINGVDSGDVIQFTGATAFKAAKVTLSQGATESTQAYLTQAIGALAEDEMGWFQYNGNTFIVMEASYGGSADGNTFIDGRDMVVMITGLVDLGTGASYNVSNNILEIA